MLCHRNPNGSFQASSRRKVADSGPYANGNWRPVAATRSLKRPQDAYGVNVERAPAESRL